MTHPLPGAPAIGVWSPIAHPGLPLMVLLGRTVLLTVTQWFVRDARETMSDLSTGSGRLETCNTLLPSVDLYVVGYKEISSMEKTNELRRWLMGDLEMMGYLLGLIYSAMGHYMRV